ncbi:MAG: hypothetical protein SFU85_04860 [Candidatus Methylacidiphilales bacterium]|nr:hypothetical protein [Candidatus Methylacidiphilales bacterium]
MKLSDIPDLAEFERYALAHEHCQTTQETYHAVLSLVDLIANDGNAPSGAIGSPPPNPSSPEFLERLTRKCAIVEESTRLIWACAAATDHIHPRIWEEPPTLEQALDYFHGLEDLDWMARTHEHRLRWSQTSVQGQSPQIPA